MLHGARYGFQRDANVEETIVLVEMPIECGRHCIEFGDELDFGLFLLGEAIVAQLAQEFGASRYFFQVALFEGHRFGLSGFSNEGFAGDLGHL